MHVDMLVVLAKISFANMMLIVIVASTVAYRLKWQAGHCKVQGGGTAREEGNGCALSGAYSPGQDHDASQACCLSSSASALFQGSTRNPPGSLFWHHPV